MNLQHMALCLFAVAPVSALAQSAAPVALYGTMDLGMRHARGLTAGHAPTALAHNGIASGLNSTSRWGIRGSEDLGGALKAVFNLESGIAADTGAAANGSKFFDRASWLGLQGSWGLISAGRQTTLLADALTPIDPLRKRFASLNPNIGTAALSRHGLGQQFGNAGSASGSYRLDNALKYSGRLGPVQASIMHGLGEVAGSSSRLSSTGLGLAYALSGATISAAYQGFKNAHGDSLDAYLLGAAYQWRRLRLSASAARNRAESSEAARTTQSVYSAGGTWSATPAIDLTLAYYQLRRERTAHGGDGYRRLFAFAEYKFTRRTLLYVELDSTRWHGGYQGLASSRHAHGISGGMLHRF